jgi:hypothetical protein
MFHTCAFYGSLANVANTDTVAVVDDILAISNNHFLPQQDLDIIYAAALGALLDRQRIVSPTNRQITLPFIRAINVAAAFATNPAVDNYIDNPFRIRGLEELAIESTNTAAGPTDTWAILGLQNTYEPAPRGNVFHLRGTSTTATVADAWTTLAVAWADILPDGTYAIVGGELIGATEIAFRCILENQSWRPGGLASASVGLNPFRLQKNGGWGVWGRFKPTRMPIIQALNGAAVAAHTVYLDIMRVA